MWQSAYAKNKAQEANKKKKKKIIFPRHLKRVAAELKISGSAQGAASIIPARIVLNDFSEKGLGLFSSQAVLVGQEISITLEEPKRFYCRGRVVWCQEMLTESNVISESTFNFRMGIEFIFGSKEEEEAIKAYCAEIGHDHVGYTKPKAG